MSWLNVPQALVTVTTAPVDERTQECGKLILPETVQSIKFLKWKLNPDFQNQMDRRQEEKSWTLLDTDFVPHFHQSFPLQRDFLKIQSYPFCYPTLHRSQPDASESEKENHTCIRHMRHNRISPAVGSETAHFRSNMNIHNVLFVFILFA